MKIIIILLAILTLGSLFTGIITMALDNKFYQRHKNLLMVIRISLQATTIAFLAGLSFFM